MAPRHWKHLVTASVLSLVGATVAAAADDPLAAYRWKARILVLSAPDATDPRVAAQRAAVAAARSGLDERDLVVLEALGSSGTALRSRLGLPADAFRAVLLGKDGEAKIVAADPIPVGTLFATIDAMPMRRDEMRR